MDRKIFFDKLRSGLLGPTLDAGEVEGTEAILDALEGLPLSWQAYGLATAYHETAHTMMPVLEAYWLSERQRERYFFRMYDINGQRPKVAKALGNTEPGDGARYPGRGYPQLTGRKNYQRAGQKLGIDLINHPEEALAPNVAADILRHGMVEGWFTGKKFSDYLPLADRPTLSSSYRNARRIINGMDKAALIADYALQFQAALLASQDKAAA